MLRGEAIGWTSPSGSETWRERRCASLGAMLKGREDRTGLYSTGQSGKVWSGQARLHALRFAEIVDALVPNTFDFADRNGYA